MNDTTKQKSAGEIEAWLVAWVAKELDISPDRVRAEEELINLGMTSRQAVILSGDLEDLLGRELDPALAWDHPTIRALARHLGGERGPAT
jgi:acyl carrier protein